MSEIPRLTPAQRSELDALGVIEVQIEKLDIAVSFIHMHLRKPAARNEVKSLLTDLLTLSSKLMQIIGGMNPPIDESHSEAFQIIEQCTSSLEEIEVLGPVLLTSYVGSSLVKLSQAAKIGLDRLPQSPTRNKAADFYPVKVIEGSLLLGWLLMHMSDEEQDSLSLHDAMSYADTGIEDFQLPHEFRPSASPNCAFRRIVGMCYEAAGGNPDPERALNAFMAYKKDRSAWVDRPS